jgi:hypothetical protein
MCKALGDTEAALLGAGTMLAGYFAAFLMMWLQRKIDRR